jgi:hypothetical protein|tara:strand:- start:507 stop:923 length:417 start_codon:yes stop_codon:yes gene_type:complete
MKKITKLGLTGVLLILFAGCSSTKHSHIYSTMDISVTSEMKADIAVNTDKKLKGEAKGKFLFNFIQLEGDSHFADGYGGPTAVGKVKSAAAYKAISQSDGDILVSPQYVIMNIDNLFIQEITVIVTGYEGKVVSINKE